MNTPYTTCCGKLAKTPKKWLITRVAGFIGSNLSSYAPTHRLAERVRKWGQTPLPNNENSRYIIKNKCSNYWCDMEAAAAVLFGKTRQAVLALLFEQPEQACYLRNRRANRGQSGALQHELGRPQKADLVERIQDGNRVTYRANTAHPVFAELQSIVRKTCGLPAQIKAALQPLAEKIRFAALYGSLAKGVNHARSDVNLLIIGDLNLEQALAVIVPVEAHMAEKSASASTAQKTSAHAVNGEHFINNVMSGPLLALIGNPGDA